MKNKKRTIVQFWHEGHPPDEIGVRMQKWKELNPKWSHLVYDKNSAADYLAQAYGTSLSKAFLDIRLPAMMADVFRVARILDGGGLYIDAATICEAPLDSWLPLRAGLLVLAKSRMDASCQCWTGLIYARKPGHPFLRSLWRRIYLLLLARKGSSIWRDFGPGLYWEKLRIEKLRASVQILPAADLMGKIEISSSYKFLPRKRHWSKRQKFLDSLYCVDDHPSLASLLGRSLARAALFLQGIVGFEA